MPIHLTPRDIAILTDIGDHGMLDTEMIRTRHFPNDSTGRACERRLKLLCDAGFTKKVNLGVSKQKPKRTATSKATWQRVPAMHFLLPAGAEVVEAQTGSLPKRITRSEPKPMTLLHRRLVVQVRLALDAACDREGIPRPEWILEQDARDGSGFGSPSERLVLYDTFQVNGRTVACRPDAASLLRMRRGDKEVHLVGYYEVDRSTESDFDSKLPGYAALLSKQAYRRHWQGLNPGAAVRVFCVCRSHERIGSVVQSIKSWKCSESFRFGLHKDMTPDRILTEAVWMTMQGELRAILPRD